MRSISYKEEIRVYHDMLWNNPSFSFKYLGLYGAVIVISVCHLFPCIQVVSLKIIGRMSPL